MVSQSGRRSIDLSVKDRDGKDHFENDLDQRSRSFRKRSRSLFKRSKSLNQRSRSLQKDQDQLSDLDLSDQYQDQDHSL